MKCIPDLSEVKENDGHEAMLRVNRMAENEVKYVTAYEFLATSLTA
jgi:hypothetical protein